MGGRHQSTCILQIHAPMVRKKMHAIQACSVILSFDCILVSLVISVNIIINQTSLFSLIKCKVDLFGAFGPIFRHLLNVSRRQLEYWLGISMQCAPSLNLTVITSDRWCPSTKIPKVNLST